MKKKNAYHSQTNVQLQNGTTGQKNEDDSSGTTHNFNNLKFLQPSKVDRRLSESLPKDIDRLSLVGRKLGTVSKPCQTEFFEQNEDEISPMIEKYRQ